MAEILPRHYIIGIIMFTFFVVGGIALMTEFSQDDPTFLDNDKYSTFNTTFNKYDQVTTNVNSLRSNIEDADVDYGAFGVLNSLISSGWNTLKLLFTTFSFMNGVFIGLYTIFGVPVWIPALIILLITVVISFAIYSAIFQREI
jgi:hypothetical protein